jgi:hypothetical protein
MKVSFFRIFLKRENASLEIGTRHRIRNFQLPKRNALPKVFKFKRNVAFPGPA